MCREGRRLVRVCVCACECVAARACACVSKCAGACVCVCVCARVRVHRRGRCLCVRASERATSQSSRAASMHTAPERLMQFNTLARHRSVTSSGLMFSPGRAPRVGMGSGVRWEAG